MGAENCFTNSYNLLNNSMAHSKQQPDGHWHWDTDPKADLVFFWHGKLKPHQKILRRLSQESGSMRNLSQEHSYPGIKLKFLEQVSDLIQIQNLNIAQNTLGSAKGQSWYPWLCLDPKQMLPAGPSWIAPLQVLLAKAMFGFCWIQHLGDPCAISVTAPPCWPSNCVMWWWAATFYLLRKRICTLE